MKSGADDDRATQEGRDIVAETLDARTFALFRATFSATVRLTQLRFAIGAGFLDGGAGRGCLGFNLGRGPGLCDGGRFFGDGLHDSLGDGVRLGLAAAA